MEENKVNAATNEAEMKTENKTEATAQAASQTQETPKKSFNNNGPRGGDFKKGGKRPNNRFRKPEAPKEYEERVVALNRVTKVVKGGKRMKFAALVVIGNGKGKFGFATGKSGEVPDAIKKAVDRAKRNTQIVKMSKGTITHDVVGIFGATKVFLKPAPEGTGIVAGGSVRAILELSGVKNVYSKVYGSRTAINVIRATSNAISQLVTFKDVENLRKGGHTDVK